MCNERKQQIYFVSCDETFFLFIIDFKAIFDNFNWRNEIETDFISRNVPKAVNNDSVIDASFKFSLSLLKVFGESENLKIDDRITWDEVAT